MSLVMSGVQSWSGSSGVTAVVTRLAGSEDVDTRAPQSTVITIIQRQFKTVLVAVVLTDCLIVTRRVQMVTKYSVAPSSEYSLFSLNSICELNYSV